MGLSKSLAVAVVMATFCACSSDERILTSFFHEAIAVGEFERAAGFLERGADIDFRKYRDGDTLLVAAAGGTTDDNPTVKFLLDHGANPNARGEKGRTAIQRAAKIDDATR